MRVYVPHKVAEPTMLNIGFCQRTGKETTILGDSYNSALIELSAQTRISCNLRNKWSPKAKKNKLY